MSLEQLGTSSNGRSVGEPQGALIMSGRLTVSANRGGAFCSSARVFERRLGVSGSLGMVSEALKVEVASRWRGQCGERPTVQVKATPRRQRILER
jgi:hypothetical protein